MGLVFQSLPFDWSTEQSELTGVETEILKSLGEQASEWTSNRLPPFIRERAPQHHSLVSYWPEVGHSTIFEQQERLEKTVSGVSRHFILGGGLCH